MTAVFFLDLYNVVSLKIKTSAYMLVNGKNSPKFTSVQ